MKIVKCGVPQGSILGQLLFLIFVNDLNNSTKVLPLVLFADDTNLFCSNNNRRTLFEVTNQGLSQINYCFFANKLYLKVGKTKYMLFHKLTDQENIPLELPSLQMNGNRIERENSLKFLGVILDEHLTWEKHIQLTENKFSKNIGVLYKTLNVYEAFTSLLYTLTSTMQISHGLALMKKNWKNYLGNKNKLHVSYLIKTHLPMPVHNLRL